MHQEGQVQGKGPHRTDKNESCYPDESNSSFIKMNYYEVAGDDESSEPSLVGDESLRAELNQKFY